MKITLKEQKDISKNNLSSIQSKTKSSLQETPKFFEMKTYEPNGLMQKLSFMLIRPSSFSYNPNILLPNRKLEETFRMETHEIPFQLTLYLQNSTKYVLLYLHGNGSSRFEGSLQLNSLPKGVGLACFDFKGCGNRAENSYITLGKNESKEVDIAAKHLKGLGYKVVGWGRSMGAVSLLMSEQCDIMIVDSPYSNLSEVCRESSSKFLPSYCCCIFNCFYPCVYQCIRCKIQSLTSMDISEMNILNQIEKLNKNKEAKQICFLHGQSDTLINVEHSQKLYESFDGRKMLMIFQGTHNSSRSPDVLTKCYEFINQSLSEESKRLSVGALDKNLTQNNPKIHKLIELENFNEIFSMSQNKSKKRMLDTQYLDFPELNKVEIKTTEQDLTEFDEKKEPQKMSKASSAQCSDQLSSLLNNTQYIKENKRLTTESKECQKFQSEVHEIEETKYVESRETLMKKLALKSQTQDVKRTQTNREPFQLFSDIIEAEYIEKEGSEDFVGQNVTLEPQNHADPKQKIL